ncbi:hypothetical protein TTHERM_00600130 (macronuclear) [Tetrahymena thermophila SB210]|uniref:Uncharacterized protein n=1 Tax=Tetrahymena thermophila (strain SB210) TaxID=312017 RepID=I7LT92_TETTS|nr:hypothetical protein TTHERM_00600130 [Tetrahymena thermophila SB210]EAR84821.2 hypothetical protein TTHERM_00600130 [Tetrahymena thermophila SB210]|eukprot:XP_001032484.2 hypothetical protein TTHERM_00600130 [Tetrahymena thermophila SB210]
MNINKNISLSSNQIDKYESNNNNHRDVNNQIQSFSQIQTSPSLKYLTQNTLPTSPSKVYQQNNNHLGHRLSNRSNQLRLSITNNGEIQFFSPRGSYPSQNKVQNANTYRHQASKYLSSQIELQKQQAQQSELQIYNEHLEIKEMGGGPGNIQKTTQHFFQIKKGNHIPLKQINAIQKSQIQKQCLTEQSDIQNSHYFSSSNTFLKGVYMNQRNNLSANNISLLKQQSKINNERLLTDQSELFQSPAQQQNSTKKFQTQNSMQLDNKKDNSSLDKFSLTKTNAQEEQQNKKKSVLLRYNSGNQKKLIATNFPVTRLSKERSSLEDIQKQYETEYSTQNLQTDEGFNNYSIIGNVQSSPMLKRKSIEKNLLLKQQIQSSNNITAAADAESKNKAKNEINLFQRNKQSSDNLRNNKNANSNMNSTCNTFKQPSALNNFFNTAVSAPKNNSKFKSSKALNSSNSQNNIMQSDKPSHSRNNSPLQNNNFSPNKTNNFNNQTSVSISKQMCLAATDYQFQKQLRLQEREQKKIRFGQEMFNNFQTEIERLKKAFINKQDPEPILNHYKVNQEICEKTLVLANKCLVFKRSRAPLETLLRIHSKSIELNKQHPSLQLFILLQIAKIFIEISSPLLAIPILKVVKRQSFLNMQNEYLMKSYRSLAQCYCTIQKFEIAFGYAAKYLHLSWTCDSANNELGAYEMLGKIYFYLGDARKSAYYHNRMAMNIREEETSSLRKMQIENLKALQKRRYEIIAAREIKKNRKKLEDQQIDGSLYIISSDEENDLNQLIPEENKDLLLDHQINQNDQQKKNQQEQLFKLQTKSKTQIPLRKTPKFDIKSDKGCLMDTQVKANQDIRIEAKKRENFEQFLKKPYQQFIQYKSIKGIGPMRDKLLVSHKSYNKNLSNFQLSQINKKLKSSNIFFTQNELDENHQNNGESPDSQNEQIYKINQDQEINQDIKHNIEQSEYWKDSIVKNVEKALKKMIKNINYLSILREELKIYHEEKLREKTFFEVEEDNFQSEQEKIIKKMMESKEENSDQYWSHLV